MARPLLKLVEWRYALLASFSLAALFAAWYARLTATGLQFGDGGELVLAAATSGVAHPPGYPLWIAIAHVFTLLPLGSVPFRVGIFSVLCHAIAIGVVAVTGAVLTRNIFAGLFAGALLACAPLFVTWSIQPEVFALNDLLVSAIVLCTLLLVTRVGEWRPFAIACGLLGLGLANQQTIIALAPLLLWVLWYKRFELPKGNGALALYLGSVAALVIGFLLPYAHTLVESQRQLLWPFGAVHNAAQFVDLITRKQFGTGSLVPDRELQGGTFGSRLFTTAVALWPVLPAVALGGLLTDDSKLRLWVPALWGAFVAIVFCVVANININGDFVAAVFTRFALQPLVMLAPYAAFGLTGLARILRGNSRAASIGSAVLVAIVLVSGLAYSQTRSLHDEHDPRTLVTDVFSTVPHGAVLLVWDQLYMQSIPYFQIVDDMRPDVTTIVLPLLFHDDNPDYLTLLERRGIDLAGVADAQTGVDARDAIARANPGRVIYVAGFGPITTSTSYTVHKMGLTGLLSAHASEAELSAIYRENAAAMSAPGYGTVSTDPAKTTGWGLLVAAQYALAFDSLGKHAKESGDPSAARRWFALALRYLPEDSDIESEYRSVQ